MNRIYTIIFFLLMLFCGNVAWAQNNAPGGNRPWNMSDNDKLNKINDAIKNAQSEGNGPGMGRPAPPQMSQKKHTSKKYSTIQDAKAMFIYGLALNPTDSVIYVTDELILDSAQVYKKTKFLVNRSEYSTQLKNFMEGKGETGRTCSVTYATTVNGLDKKYKKEMAYLKKHGYLIKHVDQTEFRFKVVREEQTIQ